MKIWDPIRRRALLWPRVLALRDLLCKRLECWLRKFAIDWQSDVKVADADSFLILTIVPEKGIETPWLGVSNLVQ